MRRLVSVLALLFVAVCAQAQIVERWEKQNGGDYVIKRNDVQVGTQEKDGSDLVLTYTLPPQVPTVYACDELNVSPCFIELDAEEIIAMAEDVRELLPAPGEGKIILVTSFTSVVDPGTMPFDADGGSLCQLRYAGDTDILLFDDPFKVTNEDPVWFAPPYATNVGGDWSATENKGIEVSECSAVPEATLTGPIVTSSIAGFDASAGFVGGDTFVLQGGTSPAAGVVDTVGAMGVVTAFHLTDPGDGYSAGDGWEQASTSGVGTGLAIAIDSVDEPPVNEVVNAKVRFYLDYKVLDLP